MHGQAMAALADNSVGMLAGYSWRDGEQVDSAAPASLDTRSCRRETVSIDLLVKSLLALGVSKKELGRTIS